MVAVAHSPTPRWRSLVLGACLLAAAATVVGCDDGRPVREAVAPDAATVTWADCGGGFQCASVPVPRDYRHPRRGTIDVALARLPATDPAGRIGSLLVNPGGPGASGVEFVRGAGPRFPDELRARFDIVGFDPRGTGATLPVDCGVDLDTVFALDTTPDDAAERAEVDRTYAALADACEEQHGDDLALVSSRDTVRDMNRVRAALGDDELTYLGYSYGTYLGTLYADQYPRKVRAMLLDGAVDPTLPAGEATIEQAAGFERALEAFFADCGSNPDCAFHSDGDPAAAFDALVASIDDEAVPADDGRVLGPGETDIGVASALYLGEVGYPLLARALAAAADGDGAPLLELTDRYTGRHDDGSYASRQDAFWAISCLDAGFPTTDVAREALERRAAEAAPRFGVATVTLGRVCSDWPVPPVADPGPLRAAGAPSILVIGTTGDPATPLPWAEALADHLRTGALVVAEGAQHGAFALEADRCVDEIGIRYLVDGEVPPDGTRC